jgi:hypothetical protein
MNMQYEQGGAVKQAQGLAALGRGPDTELVHMTPSEIKGLNTLAQGFGGGLTVNPNTGLPEAGFLKNILPMLIGGALTIGTGGLAAPWMIGGAMGLGGLAASGGDWKQALKYGLGGFGGASIATSLGAAGAPVVTGAGTGGVGVGAGTGGVAGAGAGTGVGAGVGAAGAPFPSTASSFIDPTALSASVSPNFSSLGTNQARNILASSLSPAVGAPTLTNVGRGLASPGVFSTLGSNKLGLAASAAGMAAGYTPPKQEKIEMEKEKNFFPEGGYKTNRTAQNVAPMERDSFGNFVPRASEVAYFNPNDGGISQVNSNARNYFGPEGTEPNFYGGGPYGTNSPPLPNPFGTQYAAQGGLMGFAGGGLTEGPGDGMSDDIMTSISGQQAAALSPGEFVVPADVVSDMGNGDTGAGAKQLYAMMDRVRKARGGSVEQPDAIDPRKYMSA